MTIDEFFEDAPSGAIRFRDKWQFELKSEITSIEMKGSNSEIQEFYFFIPNSLQINDQTYPKQQFYIDQTNLIRFKTPNYPLNQLGDVDFEDSPLARMVAISKIQGDPHTRELFLDEAKIFGDIFYTSMRDTILHFAQEINHLHTPEEFKNFQITFLLYCEEAQDCRLQFARLKWKLQEGWTTPLVEELFAYIDEYISITVSDLLTWFLNRIRKHKRPELKELDNELCALISHENAFRATHFPWPRQKTDRKEFILYSRGILRKYIIDPLLVQTSRAAVDQRFRYLITGLPAAIAMLVYMTFFVFGWHYFVENSQPFIVMTVLLYVLKDRIKEELRIISYRQAARWFSDFTTKIHANGSWLGTLSESFDYINEKQLPPEIFKLRNQGFHDILGSFVRPEQIIYYKRSINFKKIPEVLNKHFYGLTTLFRLDIHQFLNKAEDAYQPTLQLNAATDVIQKLQLPRVYHLNIVLKTKHNNHPPTFSKYRIVLDKNGIKRVEKIP